MLKVTRFILGMCLVAMAGLPLQGYAGDKASVNWISIEQLQQMAATTKKPVLIDVYTDWCYYCKVMDKTTWQNDSVTSYLAEKYYTLKLNAESKEPYNWQGQTYQYEPRYKVNMLAVKLLGGNMVYPSTIIIPVSGEPEILKGAFRAKELEMIIKYYGERLNEKITPEEFMKNFKGNWK
jgi:thioredoxin-related protein